jgi:hypothetical protein
MCGAVAILPADDDARRQQYRIAAHSEPTLILYVQYSTVEVQYRCSTSVLRPDLVGAVPVHVLYRPISTCAASRPVPDGAFGYARRSKTTQNQAKPSPSLLGSRAKMVTLVNPVRHGMWCMASDLITERSPPDDQPFIRLPRRGHCRRCGH